MPPPRHSHLSKTSHAVTTQAAREGETAKAHSSRRKIETTPEAQQSPQQKAQHQEQERQQRAAAHRRQTKEQHEAHRGDPHGDKSGNVTVTVENEGNASTYYGAIVPDGSIIDVTTENEHGKQADSWKVDDTITASDNKSISFKIATQQQ